MIPRNTAREPITEQTIADVETEIKQAAENIRRNDLPKRCTAENCSKCHFGHLCLSRAEQKTILNGG